MRVRTVATTTIIVAAAVVTSLFSLVGRAADPTAVELAQTLQRKYNAVRDFSADFVQETSGAVLKKKTTERGKVLVKKPGKMLWDYTAPESKQFVSDGVNVYSYVSLDKQVFVSPVPSGDTATLPVLFLAGKGDLTRDFVPSIVAPPTGMPPGTKALKLTPRIPQPDYEWLTLSFAPDTLVFRGLATLDAQGSQSSIVFTNFRENVGLADKLFAFKPPRGVVITDVPRR
jgi:outer membrane lipoprotein carrier protein